MNLSEVAREIIQSLLQQNKSYKCQYPNKAVDDISPLRAYPYFGILIRILLLYDENNDE